MAYQGTPVDEVAFFVLCGEDIPHATLTASSCTRAIDYVWHSTAKVPSVEICLSNSEKPQAYAPECTLEVASPCKIKECKMACRVVTSSFKIKLPKVALFQL